MNRRYQVFVSSTYADLKDERARVIQALMEMDCIPAGMELFPAADEEQWAFIRKVIDDCDYYIVIVGGRYGSLTTEGISYTEKEYDYACELGLKVCAFLHQSPGDIPVRKSELDGAVRMKLAQFRDKLMSGRLVRFWRRADELPALVALSLSKTMKAYPALGWTRAQLVSYEELLSELNEARKQQSDLEARFKMLQAAEEAKRPLLMDLSPLNQSITLSVTAGNSLISSTMAIREIVTLLSDVIASARIEDEVLRAMAKEIQRRENIAGRWAPPLTPGRELEELRQILMALGVVTIRYEESERPKGTYWRFTAMGRQVLAAIHSTIGRQG